MTYPHNDAVSWTLDCSIGTKVSLLEGMCLSVDVFNVQVLVSIVCIRDA